MKTVALLVVSNVFMTIAWYGHLKYKKASLAAAIVISWGFAFFEYVFQVPANRIGSNYFSLIQLKVIQECITLVVFTVFAFLVFREPVRWNNIVSYALLVGAVIFAFLP
ncbi:MAG: DMT family protein [Pyrinomonadaceae bacterium]